MACRNVDKASSAQQSILATIPQASLDLASLTSVRKFAASFRESHPRLGLLFNNAGVMAIPRQETEDGFERQFGTNYLAHFALTGLLLPTLLNTPQSRVVTTTSMARAFGNLKFDDLNRKKSYSRWGAYGQSKTANLLFAFELQSRLAAADANTLSVAAHPGYSRTNLQNTSAVTSRANLERWFYIIVQPLVQSGAMGALPQLYAGTSSAIHGGELVGPANLGGMRGYPKVDTKAQREYDRTAAARLWDVSRELTGVDYATLQAVPVKALLSSNEKLLRADKQYVPNVTI